MGRVTIYVEGGGDSSEQRSRCRDGFEKLLKQAGFEGRMPRIVAGGGRNATFDKFETALQDTDKIAILLVDSEDPVTQTPWAHLQMRDGWERPAIAVDDQAQFMVTCMETWVMTDRAALREFFGANLNEGALLPLNDLEQRPRKQMQEALTQATRPCGRGRQYQKGKRSFQVLAILNPATLRQHLPNFQRLVETLNGYLT
ncbi:MAG: DUF4276 family protein [Chloroflexi bacterium]|nr:DUF4276 family protein [Chloroflexota bacterium]